MGSRPRSYRYHPTHILEQRVPTVKTEKHVDDVRIVPLEDDRRNGHTDFLIENNHVHIIRGNRPRPFLFPQTGWDPGAQIPPFG